MFISGFNINSNILVLKYEREKKIWIKVFLSFFIWNFSKVKGKFEVDTKN